MRENGNSEMDIDYRLIQKHVSLVLIIQGCRVKANCPLVGPGRLGAVPSMGIFLRDPSSYLREFRRKPLKTPNG